MRTGTVSSGECKMLAMDSIVWLATGPRSFDLALLGVVIAAQMTESQLGSLL
jgi:hypothetical protein